MSFHWPLAFWFLAVPLVLLLVELLRRRAKVIDTTFPKIQRGEAGQHDLQLQADTVAPTNARGAGRRVRWKLYLGLTLLVVALARPQWGKMDEPVFDQAREILIAIDLSRSMLAPDVRPSRLERAKLLVTSLLERLQGERVGLVIFAGTAFLQSPLSSDYEILNEFLPSLTPDYMPQGGSNYQALMETALNAFGQTTAADRFLVILSDGEATDDSWKQEVDKLKEKGVRVLGLGIGTDAGSIIPDPAGGYVKNESGAVVLSKLEPATLQELSQVTNGAYLDASSWVDLAQLVQTTVETGRKGSFQEKRSARFVDRFQWFLAPAFGLLLWSLYRDFPVRPRPRDIRLHPPGPLGASAVEQATRLSAIALLVSLSFLPETARAEENSAAEPLSKLVSYLSARDNLGARDFAEIARATLTYAERTVGAQQKPDQRTIRDALAAVDAGRAADASAAEWDKLRADLERFLDQPEKDQPKPDDQQQDQKQQDQKQSESEEQKEKSEQKQENQKSSDEEKDQSKQDQKGSESEQDRQDADQKQDSTKNEDSDSGERNEGKSNNRDKAFGDMEKETPPAPTQPPQPTGSNTPETQKVGGSREKAAENAPAPDPSLVVPLQRLDQLKSQDAPLRLHQMMRGEKETPAPAGKNW